MIPKRKLSDQESGTGSDVTGRGSKKRVTFASAVRDAMIRLPHHELLAVLEPRLRTVVREEVERTILLFHHSRPQLLINKFEASEARSWQLQFHDQLPCKLFTGSRIESKDRKPVRITILDAISKKPITSGPLSSVKVELLVLDGDFGADDQEDWTEQEFNSKVVREREGKRPLITGDLTITLKDGVGYIGDVSFTDNSSWIRSRKFRIGAKLSQSISAEVRIREARSAPFVVKDHRGESYKKHHPPNLSDEIWRLERIAKDGAFHKRLAGEGIGTIKDFLRLYSVDPSALRNTFGGGISNKTWEIIIEHASACVLDDKLFIYYRDTERVGLVFNSIFKVVGANFDGHNYLSLDRLNSYQMGLVENMKKYAYKNLNDLVPLDDPSVFGPVRLPSSLSTDSFSSSSFQGVHQDYSVINMLPNPDQLDMPPASNHMMSSAAYVSNVQDPNQLGVYVAQQCHPMQPFVPTVMNSSMLTQFSSGPYGATNNWAQNGSVGSLAQIGHSTEGDNTWAGASAWQGNGIFLTRSNEPDGMLSSGFGLHVARTGKPKARWCMVWAAIKWGISLRRYMAARRCNNLFPEQPVFEQSLLNGLDKSFLTMSFTCSKTVRISLD